MRIDRAMLTERDPIQLYDELTLYESELDDNGESSVTIKVRVMPTCWFVLMRVLDAVRRGARAIKRDAIFLQNRQK